MMWKVAVLCTLASSIASAEPWLCKDEYGVKSFNYDPESAKNKNCVDHPIASANHVRVLPPGAASARQRAAAFPKVDPKTQQRRDLARRQILERELAEEQKSLETATQQLATLEQSGTAQEQYLKTYQDRVRLHQTNIENLRKELGRSG
jgi:septal ring factor EnvC (AmiA/AmiB activator)